MTVIRAIEQLAVDAGGITKFIRSASGPWVYVLAFVMTFAETGSLLFFIPGEITLVLAGVAASTGEVNVLAVVVVGCVAAVLGDATGFWIGRRFGPKLRTSRLGSKMGADQWDRAERLIRKQRGVIVLVGRWIGFLRAVMPATAGMAELNYKREFLPFDLVGAVSWASICVFGGYKLGEKAETYVAKAGWALAAVVVVLALVFALKHIVANRLNAKAGAE